MPSKAVERIGRESVDNTLAVPANGGQRTIVKWSMNPVASGLVGKPRWSGLSASLGVERRSDVWSLLLRRALSIPTTAREVKR